jgi:hypothetical protein
VWQKAEFESQEHLFEGSRVMHALHGEGTIVKIDESDARSRPYHVDFDKGESHHYARAAAMKKLTAVDGDRPFTAAGTEIHAPRMCFL